MLLHDDVMAEREPEARPFPGGLRREEGVEHLLLDLGRYAGAVVSYPDLNAIAKVPCYREKVGSKGPVARSFRFTVA